MYVQFIDESRGSLIMSRVSGIQNSLSNSRAHLVEGFVFGNLLNEKWLHDRSRVR